MDGLASYQVVACHAAASHKEGAACGPEGNREDDASFPGVAGPVDSP